MKEALTFLRQMHVSSALPNQASCISLCNPMIMDVAVREIGLIIPIATLPPLSSTLDRYLLCTNKGHCSVTIGHLADPDFHDDVHGEHARLFGENKYLICREAKQSVVHVCTCHVGFFLQ